MDDDTEIFSNTINTFETLTKKPALYLSVQDDKTVTIKNTLKNLYDFMKQNEETNANSDALQRLIIDNFDEEQIWQQLELQNNSAWPGLITNVSKLYSNRNQLQFFNDDECNGNDNEESEDDDRSNNDDQEDDYNQVNEDTSLNKDNSDSSDDDSDEENFFEDDEQQNSKTEKSKSKVNQKRLKPSIVDDKFFKLSQLEQFLNAEDRKEMNGVQAKSDDEDDSEDSVDLFDDIDPNAFSDDEDEDSADESDNEDDREKYPRYEDFFDAPEDAEQRIQDRSVEEEEDLDDSDINLEDLENGDNDVGDELNDCLENESKQKKVRFQLQQSDDDESSDDNSSDPETESKIKHDETEEKSTFEIRQERLKKKIGHLENAALGEKPWQLKGEIDASNRPQNSLLEEVLEFDVSSRPAPVITQETTLKLEDIIRRRIKDKAWDDVERKIKPIDAPLEYKKELVLNQEKSKESLAQIYEQEYLKQKAALDPEYSEKPTETPKEHTEIKQMMDTLFSQLDALSNFHYTPKLATPEVKIVSNIPAISMEEVAPVATSDATLLAPEEIHKKPKGDVIGKDERTATDKKRERRQKKLKQRIKQREQERKEKLKPNTGAFNKTKESMLINKLSKDRNIEKMVSNNKVAKSSQAFFTQLQEEVRGQIKSKTVKSKKQEKNQISAKRLKL